MAKNILPKDLRGHHLRIYDDVLISPAFRALSPHDVLAYLALLKELKAYNNGDLSLPESRARFHGIKSHVTLAQCLRALRAVGLIAVTRKGGSTKGGQRLATLYRITDRECYEIRDKVEAMPATNEWKKIKTVDQGKQLIAEFEKANRRLPKLESLRHRVTGTPTAADVISALTPTSGDIDDESISQAVTYGKRGKNSMMAQV
jgi:DNA-binding PadR family transcriptional regulator